MTPRVACDTNILVSALIARGPPSRVLEMAIAERIELLLPEHALSELRRVLEHKIGFSSDRAEAAVAFVRGLAAECLTSPATVVPLSGDPDDDVIVAAARAGGAEILVTGDRRHLLPLGQVGELRILTPQALLAELAKAE